MVFYSTVRSNIISHVCGGNFNLFNRFFRALDTARVFILKRHQCDNFEEKLIAEFPNKLYLTNRIGGDIEKLRGPEQLLKVFETINQRNLLESKADLGYL